MSPSDNCVEKIRISESTEKFETTIDLTIATIGQLASLNAVFSLLSKNILMWLYVPLIGHITVALHRFTSLKRVFLDWF